MSDSTPSSEPTPTPQKQKLPLSRIARERQLAVALLEELCASGLLLLRDEDRVKIYSSPQRPTPIPQELLARVVLRLPELTELLNDIGRLG